ncbi:hypothetical protein [Anaeromicrobium sediminis]|uniref:Uncharacterized protein n=1 Tax=Anaeromicrobium sediminis TaxID=1478221 RepID=A0A267MN13_9FIRM|nr:hypothetical protein [Anaeromicrobium sediminis]PAB60265.1 hypothetical protein CCE28_05025 [Anaeromicrobium sediminis]
MVIKNPILRRLMKCLSWTVTTFCSGEEISIDEELFSCDRCGNYGSFDLSESHNTYVVCGKCSQSQLHRHCTNCQGSDVIILNSRKRPQSFICESCHSTQKLPIDIYNNPVVVNKESIDDYCKELHKKRKKKKTKTWKHKFMSDENIERMIYIAIASPVISFLIYITNDYSITFSRFLLTFENFLICGVGVGFCIPTSRERKKNYSRESFLWPSIKIIFFILFTLIIVTSIGEKLTVSTGINFLKYIRVEN